MFGSFRAFIKMGMKKKYALSIFFLTICIVYPVDFFSNLDVTEFSRSLGMATSNNIDVGKLINAFQIWFLWIVIVIFLLLILFACLTFRIDKNSKESIDVIVSNLNTLSFFGIIMMFLSYLLKYRGSSNSIVVSSFIGAYIIIIIVYFIIKGKDKKKLDWNSCKWCFIAAISMSLVFGVFKPSLISISFPIILILMLLLFNFTRDSIKIFRMKYAFVPFHYCLLFFGLISETTLILNQNKIFLGNITSVYIIFILILSIYCIYRYYHCLDHNYEWEKFSYIGLLCSIAFIVGLPQITMVANTDLYEQANTALPLSQFFTYGKIPIIESHSAHMIRDFIFGFFYKILNRDLLGSFFGLYNGFENTLIMLIFYQLFTKVFKREYALLLILIFPMFYNNTQMVFGSICYISILSLILLVKTNSKKYHLLFWCTLLLSVLYHADVGLALGVGCIIALMFTCLFSKGIISIKRLLVSCIEITVLFSSLFLIVCIVKGINPFSRALEFLLIMGKSNQNWAYGSLGDTSSIAFAYSYIIVPIIMIFALLYVVKAYYHSVKQNDNDNTILLILISLGVSYFVSFQRIIVRHSLFEQPPIQSLLLTAVLFFPLLMYYKSKKYILFLSVLVLTVIISGTINPIAYNNGYKSAFDIAEEKLAKNALVMQLGEERIQRVNISSSMKASYVNIIEEISYLIDEQETFLDFTNQTMLYSLANKFNPVFINQSPGFLMDEFTQMEFIKQVQNSEVDIPIVLFAMNNVNLGISLDELNNTYRYYKVSEFLYENYEPLEIIGDFSIWCKKDRADLKEKVARKDSGVDLNEIDISSLKTSNATTVFDGTIKIETHIDSYFEYFNEFIPSNIDSEFLNIILEYSSDVDGYIQLFYTDNKIYEENKSIKSDVKKGDGLLSISVPYSHEMEYRLDFPDNCNFAIKGLNFNGKQINKDFRNEKSQNYKLGAIPYLWGTYDTKESYKNKVLMELENDNSMDLDTTMIDKSIGNYLLLEIEASENSSAVLDFGRMENGEKELLTTYNFEVMQGTHRYMIRVSSDAFWNFDKYNWLDLQTKGKIVDMKILYGD